MPLSIDRQSLVPYYGQLKAILVDRLVDDWQPGRRIPSEAELCTQYGVSRTVVRQTLNELVLEGRLFKLKGKGTFVSEHRLGTGFVQRASGFYADMVSKNHVVTSRTIVMRLEQAATETAAHLGIGVDQPVIRFDRVRSVDGDPVQAVRTYLPAHLVPGLIDVDMTDRSLYAVLDERYGIRPGGGRRWINADTARAEDRELLGAKANAAVLVVTSVTETAGHKPFEFFVARYRADRTSFEIELGPP